MEDTHNGASNHQPPKPEEESVEKQQPRRISTALDPLMHVWFNRLRNTEHSRVCSGLEFLAAMTLVGSSSKDDDPPSKSSSSRDNHDFHDRLGACFDLFDFEHSGNLDMDVVTLLLKTSLQGLRKVTRGFSDDDSMYFELESLSRRLQDLVHETCKKDNSSSSSSSSRSKDIVTTEEIHQKTTDDRDDRDDDDDPQVHRRRRRRRRSRASSSPDQVSRPSTHQRLKKQDFVHFILTCAEMQPILSKLRQIHDPRRRDREKTFRNNSNQRQTEESHVDFHIDHHSSSSIATTKCRTKNERKLMVEIQELKKACLRSEEQLKTIQLELEREQRLRRRQQHQQQEEEEGLEAQQVTAETPTIMPKNLERTTTIKQDHNDPRSIFQYEKALIQFQAIVRGVTLRKNARRFVQALVLIQSHFRGRRSRQDFYQRPKIEKILGFRLVKGTRVIEFDIQWQDTTSSVEDETTPGHRSYYSTKDALKWTHERKIVECYELEHQDEIQKMMPIAVSMYPECRKALWAPQPEEEDEPEPATTTPEIEEDIREEEEECEVELIVDHRLIEDETLEYRVRWAGGSSPDEDEWFSREDLVDAGGNTPILLHTYENDHHLELHQWL